MKRIIILALFLMCITGTASAYGLYVNCTENVQVGLPVRCSIDGDFPPGTTFDIVFYQTQFTATEVSRQSLVIQDNKLTQYKFLDTKGLPGGNYKVEVQYTSAGEASLRSDSVTLQFVKLIDRSDELTITSPLTQKPADALRIEGSIKKLGNEGVKIKVSGPDGVAFDNWIGSKESVQSGDGVFTKLVTVSGPGEYEVEFTDAKGYIGTVKFQVPAPVTQVITTIPTTTAVVKTTKALTTVPTPWPTATKSSLSPITALMGIAGAGLVAILVMKRR
jgi:hypothetical protein